MIRKIQELAAREGALYALGAVLFTLTVIGPLVFLIGAFAGFITDLLFGFAISDTFRAIGLEKLADLPLWKLTGSITLFSALARSTVESRPK